MVFSGLYPADGSDFDSLNHAIEKLTCNDASVCVSKETSTALGMGFRYFIFYFIFFEKSGLGFATDSRTINKYIAVSYKLSEK